MSKATAARASAEPPATLREIALLFWRTATPYVRIRLLTALLLVVGSSAAMALAPLILKFVVDGFTQPDVNAASLFALVALYALSQWFARVAAELKTLVHGQADRRFYGALSDRLFTHVMHLPLTFHLERQTGALSESLSSGVQGFQMIVQTCVYTLLPLVVQLGTISFVLLKLDQSAFLAFFLIALACYGVLFANGAVRITRAARGASSAQIEARAVMTDSILNYEAVKYFTAEPVVRKRLGSALERTEAEWLRFYRSRTLSGILAATVFAAFLAATMLYATREVLGGRMTAGDFVLVGAYMIQLVAPIEQIGQATQALSQGHAFVEKMLGLFRLEQEPGAYAGVVGEVAQTAPGALTFENVSVSYGDGPQVLRDVSFHLPPGKTLAIVGASGTGKSTLVRLLTRLLEPASGRILMDGKPISETPLPVLRRSIAVVPQDTVLFSDSIGYNIAFGKPGCTEHEVREAARIAHLQDLVDRLPEGYGTRVGERGLKLSGGERQRVSIARAAIKRPRIFVFDEATSALDSRTEREILANLRDLALHATTVIIAHRLSTIVHADEIAVLHDGIVVERGSHEELLAAEGRYAALWRAQRQPHGRTSLRRTSARRGRSTRNDSTIVP